MAFDQPFGQNQQRNRHQQPRVGCEVMQEGDAYVVPDRQSLHSGEDKERGLGQEHGAHRSPREMG